MAKGRQQYFADEVSIQKEAREFAIEEALKEKIDSIEEWAQVNVIETVKVNWDPLVPDAEKAVDVSVPLVEDTLYSVDTEAALSARQWKVLYDYILNLQSRGRYLSNWNCATWLPTTNPSDSPYEYRAWDYFLVSNVSTGTNYRPDGAEYVIWTASTTVETEEVKVSDMYIYDWTTWQLILNTERPIAIDDALSPTSTNPVENRVVTQAIGTKQNIITDLQTIREWAAKWDTAVQPWDSLSTLSWDSDDIAEWSSHLFMTTSERTKLWNQSWVNTWDETNATIKAKLWTASASTDWYLTSTDWNTFNDKQDAIQDLQTIRDNATAWKNASDTIATYWDIVTHDVNEFATAAQWAKADTALQSGDNVSELVNDAGYITDAYHDSTKQDKLIAWANIQIAADWKTISATDTTYVAWDFDIKDLADTTGLRTEWSWKQDELIAWNNIQIAADWKTISATDTTYTAWPGISISNNNVISNTQTSAEWWNITWTLSDQTDLQSALDGKVIKWSNTANWSLFDVSGTVDGVDWFSNYSAVWANWNAMWWGMDGARVEITTKRLSWVYPGVEIEDRWFENNESNMYDTHIRSDRIDVNFSDWQWTEVSKTYNFLWNDRIATLSDIPWGAEWWNITWTLSNQTDLQNAINAKADINDVNTKTFYITSFLDLTSAQAAYDWYLAGKTPLIFWDRKLYYPSYYWTTSGTLWFVTFDYIDSDIRMYYLGISHTETSVTSISTRYTEGANIFLAKNNTTAFTPSWDYNPATKKYVDDAVSWITPGQTYTAWNWINIDQNNEISADTSVIATQTDLASKQDTLTAWTWINIDANNEISNTLPWPTIAATAPTWTEWALWYDTTNDVLMAYNWTSWKEAWTQMKVLSYGNSTWQDFLNAYNENAIVYCKASSNSNPWTWTQWRMAFMAFVEINSSTGNPTSVEFQYYRSRSDHNSAANQLDQVFVYKLTSAWAWTVTERNTAAKATAWTWISLTYGSGNMTIANTWVTSFNWNTWAITLTPWTYLSLNNNVIDVDTSLIATKADLANFAGFLVVAQLPSTDIKTNIIYLLWPVGTWVDKYEEYIYSNNNWIMIGDTSIDLSPYFHKTNDDSDDIIEWSTNLFLTPAERTILSNTSWTNSGDETKTSIQTKLWAASSSNSGYLTSTDWDTFNSKQNALSISNAWENIEISNWVISANNAFIITEDDVTITTTDEYWVAPYSTSYYYTNIEISENAWIKWVEWAMYILYCKSSWAASAYRNARIRIWSNWDWKPIMNSANAILWAHSYLTATQTRVFVYKTSAQTNWALHMNADTTYSAMTVAEWQTGTATSSRLMRADYLKQIIQYHAVPQVTWTATLDRAYIVNASWTQTTYNVSQWASSNAIVRRSWTQIIVPETPTDNTHAASKKYVDDAVAQAWGWDMNYTDFNWVTKTWTTFALDLASAHTPSANFTVNAPSTIKDGQVYVLRVYNGATAYTMTLGSNISNPFNVDLTLTASGIDQFVFLAVNGTLELQPEWWGGGWGWAITSNTTWTTTSISQIWVGTEEEYTNLWTYEENIAYMTY